MTNGAVDSLARKRDRAIAIILRHKEDHLDDYLPPDASTQFRKVVLDQLNELHDLSVEIVESVSSGAVLNEVWLEKLDEIHEAVVPNGEA